MQDEWTGRSLVEYYVCAGVGARLVPQRTPHSQMQPPEPPPRAAPPGGTPGERLAPQRVAPQRPFPDSDDRFEATVLARYPEQDRPTTPFPRECPEFCFPDGIRVVTLAQHQQDPMPVTNSFVLTTADHTRVYGVCITWMDALHPEIVRRFVGEDVSRPPHGEIYAQQAVCLISRVPAFELLTQCCRQLYRLHITRQTMPLARAEVQPALDARVAPPSESTRLTLGGMLLEVATPSLLDIPRSMSTAADWLLVTKCLDAHNLLAVWALLLAEQKLLLLSAHTHVLTMACETLVAALFPFRWEHVYIPVLPSRLAGFLQAPVPFLVGATPDVVHATDEIPSDVVQVHLDNNTVLLDGGLYHKLRLPPRAKRKLLRKLQRVCRPPGPVHPEPLPSMAEEGGEAHAGPSALNHGGNALGMGPPASDGVGGVAVGVHGRLVSAFQLPPHPEDAEGSEAGGYDSDGTEAGEGAGELGVPANAMRLVKAAFLRFFTSALERLPELYVMPPANVSARAVATDFFDEDRLAASFPEQCREWLGMLTKSQAFAEFLHERLTNDGSRLEIAFFNESIDAKRNRSRRTFTKRPTPLLTTGRLPPGFACRAPPPPVRSMYERLCAAAGRSRPSASTRIALLVIGAPCAPAHGRTAERAASKQAAAHASFVESLRKEFARELLWTRLSDAPSGLVVHSVQWPSLASAHAARFTPHALEEPALRECIFELESMAGAHSAARERVRAAVLAGLAQLAQLAGASAPLCVVAFGPAGLVGCELLAELQQQQQQQQHHQHQQQQQQQQKEEEDTAASARPTERECAPSSWPPSRSSGAAGGADARGAGAAEAGGREATATASAKSAAAEGSGEAVGGAAGGEGGVQAAGGHPVQSGVDVRASGGLTTALQRCETLAAVATLGVPFGIFGGSSSFELRVPSAHAAASWVHLRGSWLHFHHRDDTLGVPIRALCTRAHVRDIECRSRPFKRSGGSSKAAGQLLYLHADAREVVQPIAKALSEVWQDTNIVFGASGEALDADERAARAASRC